MTGAWVEEGEGEGLWRDVLVMIVEKIGFLDLVEILFAF